MRLDDSRRPLHLVQQPLGESRRQERALTFWSLLGAAAYVIALALVVAHFLGGGV